jgi:uncharacterized protein YqgC (DUF456 family)
VSPLVFLVGLVIAVGVVGTLLPILPGLWLVWGACLGYGLIDGFSTVGWVAMTLVTILAVVGTAAGLVLPQRFASGAGIAARWQVLAAVLAVVGFFAIPVVGVIVGFVLGIALGAYVESRDAARSWSATVATLRGIAIGTGVQFVAALLMAVVWAVWVVVP